MFEAHVLHLLRRYLGDYVHGLSAEALRISVWKGDVVLKDLQLKAEALNSLQLPVTVKAGFIGSITLKVPWKSLGKEPVIVLIDQVFVLARPASDYHILKEEDREKLFQAKIRHIEELELSAIEATSKSKEETPQPGNSWLGSLLATIIGNLKISVSNIHIRYEDCESNSGYPFCMGVTLAKLASVTVDDQGNETFDTSGALDKLQKSLQLERLAMYHDCNSLPWTIDKRWEDLSSKEWVEIFEDGINEQPIGSRLISKWAVDRSYLVSPINGVIKYNRLGKQEGSNPDIPNETAFITLADVSLTLTEGQYHDWIKLFEAVSRYWVYIEVSHLRPIQPVSKTPHLWWHYAARASLQKKKICYRFSWDQIQHFCQLRRRYVQLYAGFLQQSLDVEDSSLRDIERDLDPKVILLWRLLAHAKVETVKSKEAAEQQKAQKSSWFSLTRFIGPENNLEDAAEGSEFIEGKLTKEEWQAINNLLNYQQDEELASHRVKDVQNMIRFLVSVTISQAVVRIINRNKTEVMYGRCDQLLVSTKWRHRSTQYDVSLKSHGLSAPEGSLIQSISNEQKTNALAATFVSSPGGESVDWSLSATISPCYVMVLVESYNRFMEFVKRSNAVSPSVTSETTAVLQMKLEKVTRRAQEQFQMVLEEQSRFALDIDLAAPKVLVPIRPRESSKCEGHFLFDFGSFTLFTKQQDSQSTEESRSIYSRFYISGRDIAAFFVECGSDSHTCTLATPTSSNHQSSDHPLQDKAKLSSLVEKCGMAVIVDQIKVPHPSFPSTCISIQVPNLSMHISPSRYHRLMELQNIWSEIMEISGEPAADGIETAFAPWNPVDLADDARILVWKGIAKSTAKWQPCFLVLSGCYLYILESKNSKSYQRCLSMAGRQLHEVPPANIGSSQFCLAVTSRGVDIHKALEVSNTWVLEFRDGEEKSTWLKGLIQATYQASAPSSVYVLGEANKCVESVPSPVATNSKAADLVVNGSLMETKLFIYRKAVEIHEVSLEETLILEVLASGGKVHMTTGEGDLTLKTRLHSLHIKDELQGHLSECSKYLAYSVVKSGIFPSSPYANESPCSMDMHTPRSEDDDFKDALSDLASEHDSSDNSTHLDSQFGRAGDIGGISCLEKMHSLMFEMDGGREEGFSGDIFSKVLGSDHGDFVSVNFARRDSGSLDYEGIDSQMTVSMSKLEFFCNRPTIVALMDFGSDLSSVSSRMIEKEIHKTPEGEEDLSNRVKVDGDWRVKGLLGYGKGRVVFNLYMHVDSVCLFLNKEDGSQLAMVVQETFQLDIKMYPSSMSIESTLDNFKLRDMSLGADNSWSWLCDIRNPGVDSLIKFKFNSYSAEDDDYEGYDYSLSGRLSAVRLVFLNRFVQEVTVYFTGLGSEKASEAVKLVDRVGDIEWLINKYEIDGSSAVKLDICLDTPIIILPRTSISKEYIQLDLGQLQVTNEVSWYGSPENDSSAVRIDVTHTKLIGLNMSIGVDGCIGKPMIRKSQGFDVIIRRSLRDVFKKVPTFSLELKVDLLHAVMSDREYNVVRDCLITNLNEEPRLPPSFRGSSPDSKETMLLLADKVSMNKQILLSRTVTIVAVQVNSAMLELCNGHDRGSPLAHISLESMWVSYRMNSLSEADLYITVLTLSILDARLETKSEMRMMLGSSYDSSKLTSQGDLPHLSNGDQSLHRIHSGPALQSRNPTILVMDYKNRTSSQSLVFRLQQPKILFVPDFLLAVAEFFVPSLGSITGKEETLDPRNDPISKGDNVILSEAIYKQEEDILHLSPKRQLVVDALGIDEYTYDGCGKIICLSQDSKSRNSFTRRHEPIIIIGRGKKLRFVNVKIENGSLLRKHTYLSNDSCYSLAFEDGVEIIELHNSVIDEEINNSHDENKSMDTSSTHLTSPSDSLSMQSFSFEGQVISPEFTFYDSTKSFMNDTSQGEKLLRARLDFSFMYSAKEKDTRVRAVVKDLMVEAGSGLTVLDPVDLSAAYTSVGDKTTITMQSTDICIHLSLSSLALLMNLINQVTLARKFGNRNPLAPCTSFDRIWVSPKENRTGNNIAFWRPQAPSNYAVLGDCMTSRPYPPSRAVMAVNNIYGRVRKPTGFTLVGMFTGAQGSELNEEHSSGDDAGAACYIWIPIAPSGYKALGCVVHSEAQPPPNHIVHCLRSDLVTSAMYSECMFTASSNLTYPSGFSIWRLDNGVGSFYAHASAECPPKDYGLDLGHIIMWSALQYRASKDKSNLDSSQTGHHDVVGQHTTGERSTSSGWDVLRSVSKTTKYYVSTPQFERIWLDKGSDIVRPVSIWRPIAPSGYFVLGDCITEGLEPPALGIIFKADNPDIAAKPLQFTKVAQAVGKGVDDQIFFWFPIAPPGYVSLGCVVSRAEEAPPSELFCCPRMDLVNQANIFDVPTSTSSSSIGQCWSIWRVENQACTFLARSDMKKPPAQSAYTFCDSVRPKTQDNVSVGDMRLRRISLTVLDNLYGTMTPLFDATITNIKLATHGKSEEMDAVLISSIAASAFNTQLEAWEPLIEPFDGIFKFETFATSEQHSPSVHGKRLRVASTSILNINVTGANLETFVETADSWRRIMEIDQRAAKLSQEASRKGEDPDFSALDEDDFQTVIVENKLGCDVFLKRLEDSRVDLLQNDDQALISVPPPRFSDRLNAADEFREARQYVGVQILEAKNLPTIDDGNSHSFFCTLVVNSQPTDHQRPFPPQSARTRCVTPFISENNGIAKWGELFIFEAPRKATAQLEVEVTNLSAQAGKGEVVGSMSLPVGHGANRLKKLISARIHHQAYDVGNVSVCPLKIKVNENNNEQIHVNGNLSVSTYYFERKTSEAYELADDTDRDVGFWVGTSSEGEWESVRSILPVSVIPKSLQDDFVAMEVTMINGKKHINFRGLVTVVNDSDIKMEIVVCPISCAKRSDSGNIFVIEGSDSHFTAISPGSSAVLPWRSTQSNSNDCFLVRPYVEPPDIPFSWGSPVSPSGSIAAKDQALSDQGSTRQEDISCIFKVNQLGKKDVLLSCCTAKSKQYWLSVGTDANALHTELNAPVYDWKISINSPLELENRLPSSAELTLWEKTGDGNFVERHRGVIYSRKGIHIHSVDLLKPIYLSLYVQGGWVVEKDPVLVLDMSSKDRVSSFWIVHQQSRRRLRVSIEHNLGENISTPKAIRFFVPYWIVNETNIPLVYRMVELEEENAEPGYVRTGLRNPTSSMRVLEIIEDNSSVPSMLSPQDYFGANTSHFSSQKDAFISPRVGISVALCSSETSSPGIALHKLESKERINVNALSPDGSYYKLSAHMKMTSDRTKVVYFQPQVLFINRVGCSICLQQCDSQVEEWIHPSAAPKLFKWQSSYEVELLQLRLEGYKWSSPFDVSTEGTVRVFLQRDDGSSKIQLKLEVRSGTKSSRYEVLFCLNSFSSPYRIENRSMFLPIHFRQADASSDCWQFLLPNAAASFLWEDLGKPKLLEVLVGGTDTEKTEKYDIDNISDFQPVHVVDGPVTAVCVTVLKEDKIKIVRITDWMGENESTAVRSTNVKSHVPQISGNNVQQHLPSTTESEFHIVVDLAELGVSMVDHTPEEILYLSVQNLMVAYSTGLGSGISRFTLKLHALQVDNQLPLSPMPVLLKPPKVGEETDYILKVTVTMQSNGSLDLCIYPYIGIQLEGCEKSAFVINIHEPIIWRIHEMVKKANLKRLSNTAVVSVDPIIQIGVLDLSEVQFKVTMSMSPSQRPRGVLGFWASLMTALGNTDNMPVKINQRNLKNVSMRQSCMTSNAISHIRKDILSQPFQLLSGVDILGNASNALGNMSKGIAALSMDEEFIQSRSQGQENMGVVREGGGALAKGLFRGVTGILTKPLEGAMSSGIEGFVQGVGKGIIGVAAQPMSGVLDLLSKTTQGANAFRLKILSAIITSQDQLLRRRLSRAIAADNLLRPFDEYKAQGQVILQLAECGSLLGQVDLLFKVRGKFALSDSYENHFLLPKGKIVVITHRRIILLQQNIIGDEKKFNPARDPCSVLWDVVWDNLGRAELAHGKKDLESRNRSRLLLYVKNADQHRIVKCNPGTNQALQIYNAVQTALNTFGPNKTKEMVKNKVRKPYSPTADVELTWKQMDDVWYT